jgi:hypothetical protein
MMNPAPMMPSCVSVSPSDFLIGSMTAATTQRSM